MSLILSFSFFIFDSVALFRIFSHVYLVAHRCRSHSQLLAPSSVCLFVVPSPNLSLLGLFAGAYASFWDSHPMGSFLADKKFSGVRSLKEKWERNGKGIHEGYGQTYVNGNGSGNLPMKKICQRQPAIFFGASLASRRKCLQGFWTNFLDA